MKAISDSDAVHKIDEGKDKDRKPSRNGKNDRNASRNGLANLRRSACFVEAHTCYCRANALRGDSNAPDVAAEITSRVSAKNITRGSRNLSNARGTLIRQKRRRISRWSGCALESKESDVHAVGFTKEINAEILADNKKVNFQIDCGESINIVPAKHAQGHEIKSTTKTLRTWNGSHLKEISTARIILRNPKTRKKYSVEFVVVESDLTPLIRARVAQEMELITTNEEPMPWVSSLAVATKKSGALRVCIDPRPLNEALKRETYQIPILDEILPELSQAKVFSTVDLGLGYWYCVLDHEFSRLTTFSTPFRRLPFGLSVSSEIFQKRVHQALEGMSGALDIADDILVYGVGNNEEEATADHNRNLEALLQRCSERNIALNRDKLKLKRKEFRSWDMYSPHMI